MRCLKYRYTCQFGARDCIRRVLDDRRLTLWHQPGVVLGAGYHGHGPIGLIPLRIVGQTVRLGELPLCLCT